MYQRQLPARWEHRWPAALVDCDSGVDVFGQIRGLTTQMVLDGLVPTPGAEMGERAEAHRAVGHSTYREATGTPAAVLALEHA